MRVLLITAPLTDLYTAYPAVFFLAGHLRNLGYNVSIEDLSLKFGLHIFSERGLKRIAQELKTKFPQNPPPKVANFFKHQSQYIDNVELAIRHLQGKEPGSSFRIAKRKIYPDPLDGHWAYENRIQRILGEAKADPLEGLFGTLGMHDRARYLSSVFLSDVTAIINQGIDPFFGLANYGVFKKDPQYWPGLETDVWQDRLESDDFLLPTFMDEIAVEAVKKSKADLVGISVPFNHTAFGALRMARAIKKQGGPPVVLGGHFPTTSLRKIESSWIFQYVDYVVLDSGEKPMECFLEYLRGIRPLERLLRTHVLKDGKPVFISDPKEKDIRQDQAGLPSYKGVQASDYPQIIYKLDPPKHIYQSIFSNKLKLSHGCYWRKCTFCETKLDYIGNYEHYSVEIIFDQMKRVIAETGSRVFHFTDEALPPNLVRKLCQLILNEKLHVNWWGYIRLDPAFNAELCQMMASAGCISLQAGVEAPVERLLKLMKKGITLEQVAQVSSNFSKAGILLDCCLMYGFPTQTTQEIVDGLEFIRQLFVHDCVHAGGWSKFYFSPHAGIAEHTEELGMTVEWEKSDTLNWKFPHKDRTQIDYDQFRQGLARAMEKYSLRWGLEKDVREWFNGLELPQTTLSENFVEKILARKSCVKEVSI